MRKFYFILFSILSGTYVLSAQDCSELFFSEYIEGSDNSKAIEIYNPTDNIIDLSRYWVARYSNGSSTYAGGGITQLQGFLTGKDVFILVNGQTEDLPGSTKCSPELQAKADQLDHTYPAPMYMNGNDAIALLKDPDGSGNEANFIPVDLFGTIGGGVTSNDEGWANFTNAYAYRNVKDINGDIIGKDSLYITNYIVPGTWYWLAWTANHSLYRKPNVAKGTLLTPGTPFNVTLEWDTVSNQVNDWSHLGYHNCSCGGTNSTPKIQSVSKIIVYPNPVTDGSFSIITDKLITGYEIINSIGQVIRSHSTSKNEFNSRIYLDDLTKGMLLIRVKFSETDFKTEKIFIQ